MAPAALSQALDDIDLERYQREALERARSDTSTQARTPGGLRSGTLGGGAIPAQVHAELTTLREELTANRLAAERLAGLDRLVTILVARGLQPVFVLEDTEAAVGGAEHTDIAAAFLSGPVHAFVHEVQAPCLIAIQDAFRASGAFAQLAANMRLVEIPALDENRARGALGAIITNRLRQHDVGDAAEAVLTDDAHTQLVSFYDETERSLRFMLAALQSAAEYAADMRAQRIADGHVRAAIADWRERISG